MLGFLCRGGFYSRLVVCELTTLKAPAGQRKDEHEKENYLIRIIDKHINVF